MKLKRQVIVEQKKEEKKDEILEGIRKKFEHLQGIAFTVPISSMIGLSLYKFITMSPIDSKTGGK